MKEFEYFVWKNIAEIKTGVYFLEVIFGSHFHKANRPRPPRSRIYQPAQEEVHGHPQTPHRISSQPLGAKTRVNSATTTYGGRPSSYACCAQLNLKHCRDNDTNARTKYIENGVRILVV